MLGEFFSAEKAREGGLINDVVDEPLAVAMAQAKKLAAQPPAALRLTKAMMRAPQKELLEKVLGDEFANFDKALQGPEFAEALAAFFDKRPADFSSFE
jgi:enoyl-CoA hydratase/carnithine racemase